MLSNFSDSLTYLKDSPWGFLETQPTNWIGLRSVLRPRQHSIGYMGDGFHRSKDPTNSIKVLKENLQKKQIKQRKQHKTEMHRQ